MRINVGDRLTGHRLLLSSQTVCLVNLKSWYFSSEKRDSELKPFKVPFITYFWCLFCAPRILTKHQDTRHIELPILIFFFRFGDNTWIGNTSRRDLETWNETNTFEWWKTVGGWRSLIGDKNSIIPLESISFFKHRHGTPLTCWRIVFTIDSGWRSFIALLDIKTLLHLTTIAIACRQNHKNLNSCSKEISAHNEKAARLCHCIR